MYPADNLLLMSLCFDSESSVSQWILYSISALQYWNENSL